MYSVLAAVAYSSSGGTGCSVVDMPVRRAVVRWTPLPGVAPNLWQAAKACHVQPAGCPRSPSGPGRLWSALEQS